VSPTPPDLDDLLHALRVAGLPVGAREILRLHHVFDLTPTLGLEHPPDEQLHDLLRAALAHDPEEGRLFDRVYAVWWARWQEWLARGRPRRVDELLPDASDVGDVGDLGGKIRREPPRGSWRRWRIAARLAAVAVVLCWLEAPGPETGRRAVVPSTPPPPPRTEAETSEGPTRPTEGNEARPLETEYFPHFEVVGELEGFGVDGRRLAYGVALLLAAVGLGVAASKKSRRVELRPPPERRGPPRLPLLPLATTGPELLDEEAIRTLVWGVERHVTERASREIDVPATARASAEHAGFPELRFLPEERSREVWLWLDATASEDSLIEPWATEIADQLARAGLPVRVGRFDGVPDELVWDEGHQPFRPQTVEAHRQTALVAVLTDGEVLRAHLEDERRGAAMALLRSLGHWPRLAVVDGSPGEDLAAVLPELPVPCILPAALPAFFGLGRQTAPPVPEVDPGTLRAWRAALALGDRPCDRKTAWAICRHLELEAPPWAVRGLGELRWDEDERAELVAWLARDGLAPEGAGIHPGSLLDHALDFWQRRFEAEAEARDRRELIDGWHGSPPERRLEVERALLALWRRPAEAARQLRGLFGGELEKPIRERLGRLAPRDGAGETLVPLPWRLAEVDDVTRLRLAEMGLGGIGEGALRRPGRLVLGVSLLVVVGLGMLGRGFQVTQTDREPRVSVVSEVEEARVFTERDGGGGWRVVAVSPDGERRAEEGVGGKELRVEWLRVVTRREVARDDEVGGVTFVGLRGGTFRMGSKEGDAHDVRVGDFWIAQTEITNEQYRRQVPDHSSADDLPVTGVDWFEARAFCRSLGQEDDRWQYDLPTEAEWEYAARAGTSTAWSFGDDERLLPFHAWYGGNAEEPREVATRAPNPWGLHDMHGNVWEWVLDCYQGYPVGPLTEDPALVEGSCHQSDNRSESRVLRGGAFFGGPGDLRSACRGGSRPGSRGGSIGFRCVRRPVRQR